MLLAIKLPFSHRLKTNDAFESLCSKHDNDQTFAMKSVHFVHFFLFFYNNNNRFNGFSILLLLIFLLSQLFAMISVVKFVRRKWNRKCCTNNKQQKKATNFGAENIPMVFSYYYPDRFGMLGALCECMMEFLPTFRWMDRKILIVRINACIWHASICFSLDPSFMAFYMQ